MDGHTLQRLGSWSLNTTGLITRPKRGTIPIAIFLGFSNFLII